MKPKKTLKHNFGRKFCVGVAISAKKVLACYVVKKNWCGAAAAELYSDHLVPALRKANPSKRKFILVEDNDPTGHKSGLGKGAKHAAHISCAPCPKHSPDLMPLDFGFWSSVNKRLRKQEAAFGAAYTETRRHFLGRLRRTILRTPPGCLAKIIGNMPLRCARLKQRWGGTWRRAPERGMGRAVRCLMQSPCAQHGRPAACSRVLFQWRAFRCGACATEKSSD